MFHIYIQDSNINKGYIHSLILTYACHLQAYKNIRPHRHLHLFIVDRFIRTSVIHVDDVAELMMRDIKPSWHPWECLPHHNTPLTAVTVNNMLDVSRGTERQRNMPSNDHVSPVSPPAGASSASTCSSDHPTSPWETAKQPASRLETRRAAVCSDHSLFHAAAVGWCFLLQLYTSQTLYS